MINISSTWCFYLFTGDAYAYTLEPVFNSTHHQFQCHIKRQKPEILYKLWFYITVTGTSFETSRYHYVVRREDVDDPNYGYHDIEFMTIKHTTGLEAHDDLILLGRMQADNPSMYNYTVHSLKKPREYTNRHPTVNPITSNRNYGVDVQFDKPFAYSSATWNKTDGCRKNLSVFKSVQKHYRDDPQPVEVITETIRNPYIYYLKSLKSPENRPHMKFIIPGRPPTTTLTVALVADVAVAYKVTFHLPNCSPLCRDLTSILTISSLNGLKKNSSENNSCLTNE